MKHPSSISNTLILLYVLLAVFILAANAQSVSSSAAPSSAPPTGTQVPTAPVQDPIITQCLQDRGCGNDTACIANCFGVPSPNNEALNKTNECVRQCSANPQQNTEQCYINCIKQNYLPSSFALGTSTASGQAVAPTASVSGGAPSGSGAASAPSGGASQNAKSFGVQLTNSGWALWVILLATLGL
ncbi:uncharacterized protein VTP21DRAFT_9742 [Calcarisporiella thermophila]|uniref:uncharacterized protein n=1 Tax=Calcarisporiella thermophila TaxID=911321 RepID=UPI003744434E